jgi:hypothetical protein
MKIRTGDAASYWLQSAKPSLPRVALAVIPIPVDRIFVIYEDDLVEH